MRIYSDLAPWFHLLTHPADYEEEASYYTRVLEAASDGRARTLLELGSGGGNNASYLKTRFECTLTDLSGEMLALSRTINPECEHGPDGRSLRYLEWTHDPDSGDTTFEVDFAVMLREPGAPVRVVHDHHVLGLFGRDVWLRLLSEAGLDAVAVDVEHPHPGEYEVFVAHRPA